MDKNGWCQIIPFYLLGMIFTEDNPFWNKHGKDPNGVTMPQSPSKSNINIETDQLLVEYDVAILNNNITTMQVRNVNYSNLNDMRQQLRKIPFVKSLNNTLLDATATIFITHDYSSHHLSNEFIKTLDRVTVVAVSEGNIIIKIK